MSELLFLFETFFQVISKAKRFEIYLQKHSGNGQNAHHGESRSVAELLLSVESAGVELQLGHVPVGDTRCHGPTAARAHIALGFARILQEHSQHRCDKSNALDKGQLCEDQNQGSRGQMERRRCFLRSQEALIYLKLRVLLLFYTFCTYETNMYL